MIRRLSYRDFFPPHLDSFDLLENTEIECDYWYYKRHAVDCMFGRLKHYRRIAMHHEKNAINYMGMLSFFWALLWLR